MSERDFMKTKVFHVFDNIPGSQLLSDIQTFFNKLKLVITCNVCWDNGWWQVSVGDTWIGVTHIGTFWHVGIETRYHYIERYGREKSWKWSQSKLRRQSRSDILVMFVRRRSRENIIWRITRRSTLRIGATGVNNVKRDFLIRVNWRSTKIFIMEKVSFICWFCFYGSVYL